MTGEIVYEGRTLAELEVQYDIDNSVPDPAAYLDRYAADTRRVRRGMRCMADVAYGDHPLERLDIYPAEQPDGPINVFIHGGGWRASSKDVRGFPAESFVRAGCTFVAVDYPLAPEAPMDQIVASVRRAIAWLWRHAAQYGADPDRIFVTGNSAGGHLGGMLIAQGWHEGAGLPPDVVKGMCGISGAYDLRPHAMVEVRSYLGLTGNDAIRNSPLFHLPSPGVRVLLAVGGDEPAEYLRQTRAYAAALSWQGLAADVRELPGHNHFSIIGELNRSGPLRDGIFRQMGLQEGEHG